jgi:hypothetical protein
MDPILEWKVLAVTHCDIHWHNGSKTKGRMYSKKPEINHSFTRGQQNTDAEEPCEPSSSITRIFRLYLGNMFSMTHDAMAPPGNPQVNSQGYQLPCEADWPQKPKG